MTSSSSSDTEQDAERRREIADQVASPSFIDALCSRLDAPHAVTTRNVDGAILLAQGDAAGPNEAAVSQSRLECVGRRNYAGKVKAGQTVGLWLAHDLRGAPRWAVTVEKCQDVQDHVPVYTYVCTLCIYRGRRLDGEAG